MRVAVLMSISHGELMDCEAVFASRELAEGFRAQHEQKVPYGFYITEKEVVGAPKPESSLRVRVIKEGFGYWDEHHVGEEFNMPIRHITECIQKGYIEIVFNNMGNNLPYDEPVTSMFDEAYVEQNIAYPVAAEEEDDETEQA
jgi:hypothetical protein